MSAVSKQTANILDYLMNRFSPVKPLASDDVQAFGRFERSSQENAAVDVQRKVAGTV